MKNEFKNTNRGKRNRNNRTGDRNMDTIFLGYDRKGMQNRHILQLELLRV